MFKMCIKFYFALEYYRLGEQVRRRYFETCTNIENNLSRL